MFAKAILFVLDRDRYSGALATAEANVAARKAEMDMRAHEAARRVKLTNLSISDEARDDAMLTANSPPPPTSRPWSTVRPPSSTSIGPVMRAPVNGFVTNLTLDTGQYASIGTKVMALIDSDFYRITGISRKPRSRR